jgi:signal transduction histidine kinase
MDYFVDDTGRMIIDTPNVQADHKRYIINDFRADDHFKTRPFVTEFPYMVSYAEVPLISPLGYVLGSYCVVDNKLRDFDNEQTIEVLDEIANTIMRHLDLIRLEQSRTRAEKLIKGLGEFMARESPVPNPNTRTMSVSDSVRTSSAANTPGSSVDVVKEPINLQSSDEGTPASRPSIESRANTSSATTRTESGSLEPIFSPATGSSELVFDTPPSTPPQSSDSNPFERMPIVLQGTDTPSSDEHNPAQQEPKPPTSTQESIVSADVRTTFGRAASLIRDSMSMDGLVFLDASTSGFGSRSNHPTPHEREDPFQSDAADNLPDTGEDLVYSEMIAGSWISENEALPCLDPYIRLPEAIIQRFIQRYPRGHVFSADEFGPIDDRYGPGTNSKLKPTVVGRRTARASKDIEELFRFLPGARYIIFLPLWHFQRETWFGATFGWVRDATRAIGVDDLNLLGAFGNSVMAEVSRFEALAISRAKSDFISSISHELRSPLHGILASGELLREAVNDPALLSMLDMIDSCGTTLLDTFNNLLDYAKINNTARSGSPADVVEGRPEVQPTITFQDLSALIQVVVDGVHLGHSKTSVLMTTHNETIFTTISEFDQGGEKTPDETVLVSINIEKRPSWITKLDAGSWKRIVMNLVGKFTFLPRLLRLRFWGFGNSDWIGIAYSHLIYS